MVSEEVDENKNNCPQCTLVETIENDVIKCLKLKWNHEHRASGFTAKSWTFYDVISMVSKIETMKKDYEKMSIQFVTITWKTRAELALVFVEKRARDRE